MSDGTKVVPVEAVAARLGCTAGAVMSWACADKWGRVALASGVKQGMAIDEKLAEQVAYRVEYWHKKWKDGGEGFERLKSEWRRTVAKAVIDALRGGPRATREVMPEIKEKTRASRQTICDVMQHMGVARWVRGKKGEFGRGIPEWMLEIPVTVVGGAK